MEAMETWVSSDPQRKTQPETRSNVKTLKRSKST